MPPRRAGNLVLLWVLLPHLQLIRRRVCDSLGGKDRRPVHDGGTTRRDPEADTMIYKIHFPEQTIEINDEDYDHRVENREIAEFYASGKVIADSVEVFL